MMPMIDSLQGEHDRLYRQVVREYGSLRDLDVACMWDLGHLDGSDAAHERILSARESRREYLEARWAMREAKRSRRISQLTLEAWA